MEEKSVNHLGVILDGNRRFAKRLMMEPWKGHEYGAGKTRKLLEWSRELGINELTLYAFSTENFNRPKIEFEYLMSIFEKEFVSLIKSGDLEKNKVRVNFIGRIDMFPQKIHKLMQELMDMTNHNSQFIVNFAMAYGGRFEIVDAAKKIAELAANGKLDAKDIDEKKFSEFLYMKDEPDMIIRTSGQIRTSNFLPFQAAYSEWFFLTKMWPEFEKADLIQCIEEFKQRKRTFGK